MLDAKGVSLGEGSGCGGTRGRALGYTAQLGLQPGEEFEIKLDRRQIRLVPVGGSDEEE
jgi:hypothetical protein